MWKETIADEVGCSRQYVINTMKKWVEMWFIYMNEKWKAKATQLYYDEFELDVNCKQSLQWVSTELTDDVNKVDSDCKHSLHNNNNITPPIEEIIPNPAGDIPIKKISENWTEETETVNAIDYFIDSNSHFSQIKYQIEKIWADVFAKKQYEYYNLLLKKGRKQQEIDSVLRFIVQDSFRFWNIMSIKKLTEKQKSSWALYFDVIFDKAIAEYLKQQKKVQHTTNNWWKPL